VAGVNFSFRALEPWKTTHAAFLTRRKLAVFAREQRFEIVRCEDLSFETQVTIFSEASVIVGAHGSGLANLIFAPPNAKIVELMGPRFNRDRLVSPIFMNLASILSQNFARVVGKSVESARCF
jgi:hypothetical protein